MYPSLKHPKRTPEEHAARMDWLRSKREAARIEAEKYRKQSQILVDKGHKVFRLLPSNVRTGQQKKEL